jgi:hypothetical protein
MSFQKKIFYLVLFNLIYFIFIFKINQSDSELLIDIIKIIYIDILTFLILFLQKKYFNNIKYDKKISFFLIFSLPLCDIYSKITVKYFPIIGITLKYLINFIKVNINILF